MVEDILNKEIDEIRSASQRAINRPSVDSAHSDIQPDALDVNDGNGETDGKSITNTAVPSSVISTQQQGPASGESVETGNKDELKKDTTPSVAQLFVSPTNIAPAARWRAASG